MSLANTLLDQDYIKEYRASHQGAESRIKQAAQYMEEKGWDDKDALRAMKKILPALSENVLKIFFSYKDKDKEAAKIIVGIFRKFSAGKLHITYMDDFPKDVAGKPWRDEIRKGVNDANWFILLLPDPREDWDWCLYETGLFEREITKADRLLCLHHPDVEMPKTIKHYQGIKSDPTNVEQLLRMIFLDSNPVPGMAAINSEIKPDLTAIAQDIVNAIRPPVKRRRFAPWVKLQINNADKLLDQNELDSARIEAINNAALNIFGKINKPSTWHDLRTGIDECNGDSRWRKELLQVIRNTANNDEADPIHAVFRSKDGKTFRPLLFAIDQSGERGSIIAFHINFVEDVSSIDTKAFPRKIATLITLLRMAIRFRWEVLEPFTEQVLVEKDFENLSNVISRIEQDSESRGLLNKHSILKLFTQEDEDRMIEMFAKWDELRDPVKNEGTLDKAIKQEDSQKVFELLTNMIPMNQEFLKMGAARFSKLVSKQG